MKIYSFEKLEVWQLSRKLVLEVYQIASTLPKEENFGLMSQLKRAAISVSSNLAEGSARFSNRDKARYTEIAFGSLVEVLNHLILAQDLGYLEESKILQIRPLIEEISNKMNKLRQAQLSN